MKKVNAFLILGFSLLSSVALAQETNPVEPIHLDGPRVGFTYVAPGELADKLKKDLDVEPLITQFGWQFETNYFATPNGTAGLIEGVILIGGLEQNVFLPSANLLIGIRSKDGLEFGFGPNVSLGGAAFVFAAGFTIRNGALNFPINFAVVPSKDGFRTSLLVGFNAQTRR